VCLAVWIVSKLGMGCLVFGQSDEMRMPLTCPALFIARSMKGGGR